MGALDLLELEFQVFVSHPVWVLRIKLILWKKHHMFLPSESFLQPYVLHFIQFRNQGQGMVLPTFPVSLPTSVNSVARILHGPAQRLENPS